MQRPGVGIGGKLGTDPGALGLLNPDTEPEPEPEDSGPGVSSTPSRGVSVGVVA